MSDQPRHHWLARNPDGSRLGAAARDLCSYLWTFVSGRARVQAAGGFVWHSAERLADELQVDKRTIERQLQQLRAAGLLRRGTDDRGRPGFHLLVLPKGSEIADRSVGDLRENDRRSPIVLAEIADRSGGDRRSFCPRSKEEQDVKQEIEQEREQDLTQARALATSASTPDGAPPLGRTRPALRWLIALLADGEDPVLVERVLRRAADIVARGLESAAYFGPDMFTGRVWTHWTRSLFELERAEQAELAELAQRQQTAAAAEAEHQAAARRAAEQAERDAVRLLCDRVQRATRGGLQSSLSRLLADHDQVEAALARDPHAALRAVQQVLEVRGDAATEAELRAAIEAAVRPRRELTPADLREARLRAEASGRSVLDVLDGIEEGA